MKKRLRCFSLFLTLVMVISIIPMNLFHVKAITTEGVEFRIISLCKKLGISNPNLYSGETQKGIYFTTDKEKATTDNDSRSYNHTVAKADWFISSFGSGVDSNSFSGGNTCNGFAKFAQWYIFSGNPNKNVPVSWSGAKVSNKENAKQCILGDRLSFNKEGHSDYHQAIFLGYNNTGYIVLDSNFVVHPSNIVAIHTISYSTYVSFDCGRASYESSNPSVPSETNYTISYNANGGSGSISSKTVKSGGTFTISSNSFTKTGYTFKGWNVKRSADSKWYVKGQGWFTENEISANGYEKSLYSSGKEYTLDNSWTKGLSGSTTYTFYAQWEVNTLSVYYNANGGTISSDTYKLSSNVVYNISDGSKYTHKWTYNVAKEKGLVNAATFGLSRAGYKFSGWGTSSSGGTVYTETDNTIKPTDLNSNIKNGSCSITLYAQWTPNTLSVYYNANGGTISSDKYKLNSNIVYNISDNTKAVQSWTYNNTKEKGLTNEKSFGISRTGYTFKGWGTTASGGTIFDADDVTLKPTDINANIKNGSCSTTLYAQWEPNTLSVYFNANGGTISSDKYKLNSNIVYNISDDTKAIQSWTYNNTKSKGLTNEKSFGISRTGYTFKGWGTTASGGTIFDADDVTLMPTDINANIKNGSCSTTLYAQWEPVIFIKKDDSKITVQDGFIYDSSIIGMTSDELMLQFTNTNIVISKPMDRISTGITIHIEDEKGQIYDELTVVIFGDVNSDGIYDGTDAMIVNCIANGMLTKEQVGEAVYMAADCNHDGTIDNLDVELLQQAGVLLASVGQNKTQEELQTSSAYVEYLNLVDQNPVNEKYNTDNEIIPSYSKQPLDIIADFFAFIKNLLNFFKTIFA